VVDVGHSKDNRHEDGEEPGTPEHTEKASEAAKPAESDDDKDEATETPAQDAKKSKKAKKKQMPFWKEMLVLVGIAIVLAIVIQSFIARVFLIPSESMERTLHGCVGCYGDRVVVDRVTYLFSDPEPGDVVVFERPDTWNRSEFRADRSSNAVVRWLQDIGAMFGLAEPNEDDVVKRVIAVGGQTIECCDSQGRVQVDGQSLDEPYVFWAEGTPNGNQEFEALRVPQGTLWG
jgi:signal peptidase I